MWFLIGVFISLAAYLISIAVTDPGGDRNELYFGLVLGLFVIVYPLAAIVEELQKLRGKQWNT